MNGHFFEIYYLNKKKWMRITLDQREYLRHIFESRSRPRRIRHQICVQYGFIVFLNLERVFRMFCNRLSCNQYRTKL